MMAQMPANPSPRPTLGCYFACLADGDLTEGRQGNFNILDARSHRIPRVCRSTYAAETLAAEEALDVGQLCRCFCRQ